jgi:hypothetical protein
MTIYTNFDKDVINYKTIALKRTAQHYKQIAKILSSDEVQKVFKKYAGKTYSKRLLNDLVKVAGEHFHFDTQFGGVYMYCTFYDSRCIETSETGLKYPIYTKGKYDIKYISTDAHSKELLTLLPEQIKLSAKYYQDKYEKLTKDIEAIDLITNEFQKIANRYNKFQDEVSYEIRNEFKLNLQIV